MLSTSLATVLLGGLVAAGSVSTQPAWHTDYGKALVQAAELKKPLAVFIAQGGDGYAKVVKNGSIPADAVKLLRQNYVCLYVDASTPAGKSLTGSFQMTEGIVISSKAGTHQALRHEGRVATGDLTGYLAKFSDASQPVQTEYSGAAQAPVSQPNYLLQRPVMNSMNGVRNLFIGGG